jgi:SAM-dependent methyltransferase
VDRCASCGFEASRIDGIISFVANTNAAEWRKFFEDKASASDGDTTAGMAYTFPLEQRIIIDGVHKFCDNLPASALILDVGCGNGLFWEALFNHRLVIGVDYSLGMCRLAHARGMQVYHADAVALPFASDQFDLIYSAEAVQYIDDLRALLIELVRVCRPGGRIVVTTLNRASLLRQIVFLLKKFLPRGNAPKRGTIHMRSAEEICAAATPLPLQLRTVCWPHFPFSWRYYSTTTRYLFAPFASSVIVEFVKRPS